MSEKPNLDSMKNKHLRILPYAHCDYAALHSRYWHKIRYNEIFDKVISLFETMPNFRWYFDCYRSQLKAIFEKYPEKKQLFDKYIAEGKLNFLGAYANIRPNMVGEETYIRNILLGKKLLPNAICEIYGEEVDVALGHAQIPQILSQFGYKLYKVYRPCDVFEAKNIPSAFVWKGFDGSEILAVRCDYSAFDWTGTENINTSEEAVKYLYDNCKNPINYSTSDLVWVNCGCDDTFPFMTNQANNDGKVYDVDIQKIISLYPNELGGSVKISSPLEFYKELQDYKNDLKTIEGTIDCCDVSYNIAVNGEKGFVPLRLFADELLCRSERWHAIAKHLGISLSFDFENEWEKLLTASCHATQWMFSEDFYEIRTALQSAIRNTQTFIKRLSDEIAKKIDCPDYTLKTVFNDSAYSGYKDVIIKIPCADIDKLKLSDGRGEDLPFEIIYSHDYFNSWEFFLKLKIFVPAYGYNVIYAKSGDVRAIYGKHCTPKIKVELNDLPLNLNVCGGGFDLAFKNGYLVKVNDNYTTTNKPFNGLTFYRYKYCGSWWEEPTGYTNNAKWTKYKIIRSTNNSLEIELHGEIENMPVVQTIYSTSGVDCLKFKIDIDWKKDNAYITSNVPVDSCDKIYCDMPFGTQTVNVYEEYSPKMQEHCVMHRKRKGVICAKSFVSGKFNEKDISVIRGNSDRYFICDIDKNTMGIVLLNSIARTEGTWEVDINDDIEAVGKHSLEYSVYFNRPSQQTLNEITPTLFTSDMARSNPQTIDKLPPFKSLFDFNGGDSVILTSLKEENNEIVLRIVETENKRQMVSFSTFGFTSCNAELLSGEKLCNLLIKDGKFVYTIKPFEIVTFRLTK